MQDAGSRQQEVVVILVWHPQGPLSFLTHVLIQVIILCHGEAGREGGEVYEQHNISRGVDLALRNGPESKMLGADSRKLLLFWWCIHRPPRYF